MLSNKYLQIQPYDASKIFKHRKWVQRSPGLWWNVPSGLPRSHGGPNFGRRLARGQLRLCVGGPSSLVGAGEIWALTNCLEMFLGFPRSFGEKTAGRSGFGTTFWWFFRWCVCFVWKNRWQKCGKFHVHQEKNNFSGKANQNGNIGGIEPKIWVCIEFVSISRRTQMERKLVWRNIGKRSNRKTNLKPISSWNTMVLERNIRLAEYKGTSMQKMSCQQLTEETAVGTYREFVIFDDECVYPEYMLLYDRVM